MAMGRRKRARQGEPWIEAGRLAPGPGHPFYRRLNEILARHGFDERVESICAKFYADTIGRPSLAPAVYFRLLLIGYFEDFDSERGIAWRVADSITLREFLGYRLTDPTPDHSTISRNRRRIDLEAHDTTSIHETVEEAVASLATVLEDEAAAAELSETVLGEIVADKGYHSNIVLTQHAKLGIRTYISEPARGRRCWRGKPAEKDATYGNRRRIRGTRGKRLLRAHGERVERTFAHGYDTGAMRWTQWKEVATGPQWASTSCDLLNAWALRYTNRLVLKKRENTGKHDS